MFPAELIVVQGTPVPPMALAEQTHEPRARPSRVTRVITRELLAGDRHDPSIERIQNKWDEFCHSNFLPSNFPYHGKMTVADVAELEHQRVARCHRGSDRYLLGLS